MAGEVVKENVTERVAASEMVIVIGTRSPGNTLDFPKEKVTYESGRAHSVTHLVGGEISRPSATLELYTPVGADKSKNTACIALKDRPSCEPPTQTQGSRVDAM